MKKTEKVDVAQKNRRMEKFKCYLAHIFLAPFLYINAIFLRDGWSTGRIKGKDNRYYYYVNGDMNYFYWMSLCFIFEIFLIVVFSTQLWLAGKRVLSYVRRI